MTNYEKLIKEMSHTRLAELLECEDFCCEAYVPDSESGCVSDTACRDCLREWLKTESE
ncbi:MAG: hypothetical protein AB7E42_10255 [Anaerotignaceae bacterium]